MTIKELSIYAAVSTTVIKEALANTCGASVVERLKNNSYKFEADFTFDECLKAVASLWGNSPYVRILMEEGFIEHEHRYVIQQPETKLESYVQRFMNKWVKAKYGSKPKCCVSCAYCVPVRQIRYSKCYPFCLFHNKEINRMKEAKIYSQKLKAYFYSCQTYTERDSEPHIYTLIGPQNLSVYGTGNKRILGFKPSDFISKRESKKDPIYLLKDGTNYKEEDFINKDEYLLVRTTSQ